MSHQDFQAPTNVPGSPEADADSILAAVDFLGELPLRQITFRRGSIWDARLLLQIALLWAWGHSEGLVHSLRIAFQAFNHLCPNLLSRIVSYQAFIDVLGTRSLPLLTESAIALRSKIAQYPQETIDGRLVFAVDGTKIDVPRAKSHRKNLSAKKAKSQLRKQTKANAGDVKKAENAQILLTVMWNVGTGLLWSWCRSGLDGSERKHCLELRSTLPAGSVIVADAGYVGYDFWKTLSEEDFRFLIRIGSNVRPLRKLGSQVEEDSTVYIWPDRKKKAPPLVLRLIVVYDHKKNRAMYLVTNILDSKKLTDEQAAGWYARRWGIEVFFRGFKQTFRRRKLRALKTSVVLMECDWSLMSLWLLVAYVVLKGPPRTFRPSLSRLLKITENLIRIAAALGESLIVGFTKSVLSAQLDRYQRRCKSSDGYPRKKKHRPPGEPKFSDASPAQIEAAKQLGFIF